MTGQSGGSANGFPVGGVLAGILPNPSFSTNGTTTILGVVSNLLPSDVVMTNGNQFYDGPAVPLTIGSWLLLGHISYVVPALNTNLTARLWDGTTTYDSSIATTPSGGAYGSLPLFGYVVLAAGATLKISLASGSAGSSIKAAAVSNPVGSNASSLYALRVA